MEREQRHSLGVDGEERIRIRRSTGKYEWVTRDELELLNEKKRQTHRYTQQLKKQRNLAVMVAVFTSLLAGASFFFGPAVVRPPVDSQGDQRTVIESPAPEVANPVVPEPASSEPVEASDPQEPRGVSSASSPASSTVASTALVADPPSSEEARVEEAIVQALEEAVLSWARAWSSQDPEAYLENYSSEFNPEGRQSRRRWAENRRQRLRAPQSIQVDVNEVEIIDYEGDNATVRFVQNYRSPTFEDRVQKTLQMKLESDRWRIVKERSQPF